MPVQLRSHTSLQLVASGSARDTKVKHLKLVSSSSAPSSSTTGRPSLKRKISNISADPTSSAVYPRPRKMRQSPKRSQVPVPAPLHPPPAAMPCVASTGASDTGPAEPPIPPSPVPTEIIDIEAEDFVRTSKAHGVKVRDYALEPPARALSPVPEVWKDPFLTLLAHDMHIRRPRDRDFFLSGRILRRLLDSGYVTQREADAYWTEEDRRLLAEFDRRPPYPYVTDFKTRPKPTAAWRVEARKLFHGDPAPGDIPEVHFEVPDLGEWAGDEGVRAFGQMRKRLRDEALAKGRLLMLKTQPMIGLDYFAPPPDTPEPRFTPLVDPVRTPPVRLRSLPEIPSLRSLSELANTRGSPATTAATTPTPPDPCTPTTPTTPPAEATPPLPPTTNTRRLGRTTTLAVLSVR
jgi:hypothetical protein